MARKESICPVCAMRTTDPSGMHRRCWEQVNTDKLSDAELERREERERKARVARRRREERR